MQKGSQFNYNQGTSELSKDYNLFNSLDVEQFNLKGVPVFYYKIADVQPNYDPLYRDFVSGPVYNNPIEVRAIPQIDENISHGMTDTGIGQVAERNGQIYFNISLIESILGRPPILGDVVYMRQFDQRFQIYHISKDTYKLSMPLRYLCKVRLYQDTSGVGTDWSMPVIEPPATFPGTGSTGSTGETGIATVSGYIWYRGNTGITGATGIVGPTGASGYIGLDGFTGNTGTNGGIPAIENTNFSILPNYRYFCDTSLGPISGLLSNTPTVGDFIEFFDLGSNWTTHNFTILSNGNNINGASGDFICNVSNSSIRLVYINITFGWKLFFIL